MSRAQQVTEAGTSSRFSRMPVYRGSLDTIEGLVYSKDIIAHWGTKLPFQLSQVLRKPFFLPDSAKVEQALEQMQSHRTHMALVVDEHGGVEGMITLEDLLEEIVGDLSDEQEEQTPQVKHLPDGQYLIDGAISVKDLNAQLPLQLPELPEYNTLAGFMLTRLGRIPVKGEELAAGGMVFAVERVAKRRVVRVKARPARSAVTPAEPSAYSSSPKKK